MHQTSELIIESGMSLGNQSIGKCHALLPTAGSGSRLGGDLPKQFRQLAGKPMLSHALEAFLQSPHVESIWIGVSPGFIDNPILKKFAQGKKPIHFLPTGGPTRQETVRNTLGKMLESGLPINDWVMVHDAARPCITATDINLLIDTLRADEVGGILALSSHDTLKDVQGKNIVGTLDRSHIWRALTPQMFKYGSLKNALEIAEGNPAITDEASALELQGLQPKIVEGRPDNIKITRPEDLALAQFYMEHQND